VIRGTWAILSETVANATGLFVWASFVLTLSYNQLNGGIRRRDRVSEHTLLSELAELLVVARFGTGQSAVRARRVEFVSWANEYRRDGPGYGRTVRSIAWEHLIVRSGCYELHHA
jgi:hypothetical protein